MRLVYVGECKQENGALWEPLDGKRGLWLGPGFVRRVRALGGGGSMYVLSPIQQEGNRDGDEEKTILILRDIIPSLPV